VTTTTTREIQMETRFNFHANQTAGTFARHLNAAGQVVTDSPLPAVIQELVKIRASQINGCAMCTDMHTKDAAHAGESQTRLNMVAAWREATVFTEPERAALELTEQGTRIADAAGGVSDEAWANAAKHFDEDQLAGLVCLIAVINTYNRIGVITRQPGGGYQPGQWG
jgi:AhpD family alkylhydroperoxidase